MDKLMLPNFSGEGRISRLFNMELTKEMYEGGLEIKLSFVPYVLELISCNGNHETLSTIDDQLIYETSKYDVMKAYVTSEINRMLINNLIILSDKNHLIIDNSGLIHSNIKTNINSTEGITCIHIINDGVEDIDIVIEALNKFKLSDHPFISVRFYLFLYNYPDNFIVNLEKILYRESLGDYHFDTTSMFEELYSK